MRMDYASFKGMNKEHTLTEIYYSFSDVGLKYLRDAEAATADYSIQFEITDNISTKDTFFWAKTYTTSYDEDGLRYRNIILGVEKLYLKPASYDTKISLVQGVDGKETVVDSFEKRINIRDFSQFESRENVMASDYQVSFDILDIKSSVVTWNHEFEKNGYYFIPLPTKEFIGNIASANYYYEVYIPDETNYKKLKFEEQLLDNTKHLISRQEIESESSGTIARIVTIPLRDLNTGVYFIKTIVKDEKGDILLNKNPVRIYLSNPDKPATQTVPFYESLSFEKSIFRTMDEEEVETEFDKINYIITDFERSQYKQLTGVEAKQRALFAMYSVRDNDTTTTFNEFLDEYMSRAEFADIHFSYGSFKEGWRTERGRVLMTYGIPEQRQQFFRVGEKNPAEIWFYPNHQGGVEFFFVDNVGIGNFVLVHSTAMNELRNPRWIEMYDPALDDTDLRRYQNSSRNYQGN